MKTSLGGDYEKVEDFIIWHWNGDIAAGLGFREVLIQPNIENLIQGIFLLGENHNHYILQLILCFKNLCASHYHPFSRILAAKVVDLTISAGE